MKTQLLTSLLAKRSMLIIINNLCILFKIHSIYPGFANRLVSNCVFMQVKIVVFLVKFERG